MYCSRKGKKSIGVEHDRGRVAILLLMHNTGMERSETVLFRVNGRERGEGEMLTLCLQMVDREETRKVLYDCR